MSSTELFRVGLTVVFSIAAAYSAVRVSLSAARKAPWHGTVMRDERASTVAHAFTGGCLAVIVFPADNPGVNALWILGAATFAVIATRFATALRRHGAMSRAGIGGSAHGGYNLHHLAVAVAMTYLCVTTPVTTTNATGGQLALTSPEAAWLSSINWLLGLYFLVAATSLGFRITEPPVRITRRAMAPAGAPDFGTLRAPAHRIAPAEVLTTPIGLCTTEVILSAGLALVLLGAA